MLLLNSSLFNNFYFLHLFQFFESGRTAKVIQIFKLPKLFKKIIRLLIVRTLIAGTELLLGKCSVLLSQSGCKSSRFYNTNQIFSANIYAIKHIFSLNHWTETSFEWKIIFWEEKIISFFMKFEATGKVNRKRFCTKTPEKET